MEGAVVNSGISFWIPTWDLWDAIHEEPLLCECKWKQYERTTSVFAEVLKSFLVDRFLYKFNGKGQPCILSICNPILEGKAENPPATILQAFACVSYS